jgi:hypothetical protein
MQMEKIMMNIIKAIQIHHRSLWICAVVVANCLWMSFPATLSAGDDVSNIPGAFLDVGLGAAPMGMAGSNVVLVHDVHALLSNPAGLTSVQGNELAFSMTKQFTFIPYNVFLYAQRLQGIGGVGVGLVTSGDDALKENTVIISYGRLVWKGISGGISLKYRQASFGNNSDGEWVYQGGNRQVKGDAKGYGVDIGVRGKIAKQLGFGVLLKDALSSVSYDASNEIGNAEGGSEAVPTSLVLGLAYVSARYLSFEFNLRNGLHQDTNNRFFFGAERDLFSLISLRGGFSQNVNAEYANRNYTLGFGLGRAFPSMMMEFNVDAAYVINDFQNYYHIGLKLGRLSK